MRFYCTGSPVAEVEACAGETVTLPCHSTKAMGVDWGYQVSTDEGDDDWWRVVATGYVQKNYKDRFSLDQKVNNQHNLVISELRVDDQGFYTCVEDAGLGPRHRYRLAVHGQFLAQSAAIMV